MSNLYEKRNLPEDFKKGTVELGDSVQLENQTQEVVQCQVSDVLMLNIDADELAPGDLVFIKKLGLTISNPETEAVVALGVEYKTLGRKLADWFESDSSDDDDDTPFFSPTPSPSYSGGSSSGGLFGGSGGFGGFGGGFGFGGGASRGF